MEVYNGNNNFKIHNLDNGKDIPLYNILNCNKFFFIEEAIRLNPFNSTHFVWLDFRINYVAQSCEEIHNWIYNIPDKIKQLCINPYYSVSPIQNLVPDISKLHKYSKKYGGCCDVACCWER